MSRESEAIPDPSHDGVRETPSVNVSTRGEISPSQSGFGKADAPANGNVPSSASGSKGMLRDIAVTFASRVLAIAIGVGMVSATARLLGTEGKGELAACLVFAQLLVLGLGFGFEMGCAYYAGSGRKPLGEILGVQVVAFVVTGTLIVVVGVGCLYSSLAFVNKAPISAFICAIGFALAQLFFVYMTVLFMGLGRLTQYNLARIVNQASTLIILAGACWFLPNSTVAVLAYACGSLLAGMFLLISLLRNLTATRIHVSRSAFTACYRYGIKYYFGKLSTLTTMQMGVIVMSFVGTSADIGIFSAALGLASPLSIVPDTLNIVLLPRVLVEQSNLASLVARSCRVAVLVTLAGAILLALLARPAVVILMSAEFLPAVAPLLILLPGTLVRCFSKVLVPYFNGIGRPEFNSITLAVALVVNLVLAVILVPRWGLIGAATATSVGFVAEAAMAMLLFTRTAKLAWREFMPRPTDIRIAVSALRGR